MKCVHFCCNFEHWTVDKVYKLNGVKSIIIFTIVTPVVYQLCVLQKQLYT
jgi:hypothetical protein